MNLIEAKQLAEAYDQTLLATDERFKNCINIIMNSQDKLYFRGAFALIKDQYYFIFTENTFGFFVLHKSDIHTIEQRPRHKDSTLWNPPTPIENF